MKRTTKKNNLVKKFDRKMMSLIMSRAWKLFYQIPVNERVDESFSNCLRKSWSIAKNGKDNQTFEQVYNKNYKQILYYVNGWVKNMTEAEDITAKVFIKLHKNFEKYDVYQAKISTYLHVIAKSMITDHYRTNHSDKYVNVNSFVDDDGKEIFQFVDDSTNDGIENDELSNSINTALSNLKPKYKQIAELFFVKEMTYKEISTMLNLKMGTVKGMINRCRAKLQEELKDVRTLNNANI